MLQSNLHYMTDGGMETTLIYHQGIELPHFAAIVLLQNESGIQTLTDYYRTYLDKAVHYQTGFILESPTWRGGMHWAEALSLTHDQLKSLHATNAALMHQLRSEYAHQLPHILISGCVGPAGDGYLASQIDDLSHFLKVHQPQMAWLASRDIDLISAFTFNTITEAEAIARLAAHYHKPVVISFTLETDGNLPSGATLEEAITYLDALPCPPEYYMLNCVHPNHFVPLWQQDKHKLYIKRIKGLRTNASCKSHEELASMETLDDGCPTTLGQQIASLQRQFPEIQVIGGCCGTDLRHVDSMLHHTHSNG